MYNKEYNIINNIKEDYISDSYEYSNNTSINNAIEFITNYSYNIPFNYIYKEEK